MKNKWFLSVATVSVCILTLLAMDCAQPAAAPTPAPAPKPVNWVLVSTGTAQSSQTKTFKELAKVVSERTKGMLTLDVRISAEMGFQGPELLQLYEKGAMHIGQIDGGYYLGDEPLLAMDSLPFLGTIDKYPDKVKAIYPYFESVLDKRNIKTLAVWIMPSQLWENKEIRTIDDFKGRKIRVMAAPTADFFQNLGAQAVAMDAPELYQALATGVVTGTVFSVTGGKAFGIHEVTKYLYISPPISGIFVGMVINKNSFNSLSADVQKVVVDTAREYERKFLEGFTIVPPGLIKSMTKITAINNLDPQLAQQMAQKGAYKVWDAWLAKYPSTKPALDAVLSAVGMKR
jgi:TRAP-type C4-dicarboxylate transport system substrate-binding protein